MEELIFLHDFINMILFFIFSLVGFILLKELSAYLIRLNIDGETDHNDDASRRYSDYQAEKKN